MYSIKFSHYYLKMNGIDLGSSTILAQVIKGRFEDLSETYRTWDTAYLDNGEINNIQEGSSNDQDKNYSNVHLWSR